MKCHILQAIFPFKETSNFLVLWPYIQSDQSFSAFLVSVIFTKCMLVSLCRGHIHDIAESFSDHGSISALYGPPGMTQISHVDQKQRGKSSY